MNTQMQGRRTRQRIYTFIRAYKAKHGVAPNVREIGAAVGLASNNSVCHHLHKLVSQGALLIDPHVLRGIRLPGEQYVLPDPAEIK